MSNGDGYIEIVNWERWQHRDALRAGPPLPWQKLHTAQLDDDAYLDLSLAERGLLHDLRMLVARTGQGRLSASTSTLRGHLGIHDKNHARHFQGYLDSLIQAGFIRVHASKTPAQRQHATSTESREELRETITDGSPALSPQDKESRDASTNGPTRGRSRRTKTTKNHQEEEGPPLTRAERQAEARRALEHIQAHTIKDVDQAPPIADDDELI